MSCACRSDTGKQRTEKDDPNDEIDLKFRRGYPQDNIIFEDSRQAILIQNPEPVIRCGGDDPARVQLLLAPFFVHERASAKIRRHAKFIGVLPRCRLPR